MAEDRYNFYTITPASNDGLFLPNQIDPPAKAFSGFSGFNQTESNPSLLNYGPLADPNFWSWLWRLVLSPRGGAGIHYVV